MPLHTKIVNLLTAQGFGGWKDGPVGKVPAMSRKTQVPIPSTHWKPNMGALVCNPVSGAGSRGHALMKGFTEFPREWLSYLKDSLLFPFFSAELLDLQNHEPKQPLP